MVYMPRKGWEGKYMSTGLKRFTISVTSEMEEKLNALKKEKFYNTNQTEMIRYLIELGLNAYASAKEKEGAL